MAGQTLSEIRGLLAAAGLAPRQRYGQNFLIDLNLMRKLVGAAELEAGDVVLEVGCGTGSLTEMLLEAGARVVGVEIDHGLQAVLRERLGQHPRFTLIQGDALAGKHAVNPLVLQVLAEQLNTGETPVPHVASPPCGRRGDETTSDLRRPRGADATTADGTLAATTGRTPVPHNLKLVSNLPYQIATPLLMELLYVQPRFERLTCTIQREVGERMAAEATSDAYGLVSVVTQSLADIHLLAILPGTAFWPRPEVESVMLTIRPRPAEEIEVDDVPAFVRFVQRGFIHRRKTLKKAAEGWGVAEPALGFARARINSLARPEALTPADWRALYRAMRPSASP